MLVRAGIYSLGDVFPHILPDRFHRKRGDGFYRFYDGKKVRMTSPRYHCFAASQSCYQCGLVGTYFALEQNRDSIDDVSLLWHFNLYGVDSRGQEVLMTKDHLYPRSLGGADHQSNYRTMCQPCNRAKGHSLPGT